MCIKCFWSHTEMFTELSNTEVKFMSLTRPFIVELIGQKQKWRKFRGNTSRASVYYLKFGGFSYKLSGESCQGENLTEIKCFPESKTKQKS